MNCLKPFGKRHDVLDATLSNHINSAEADGEALYSVSSYYAMFGYKANSIKTLEKAINSRYFNYPFMESISYFDNIRNDSEFIELLNLAKAKHLDFKEIYGH